MEIWFIKKIKGVLKKKSNPSINSIEEITNKKESIASVNELYGKYKSIFTKKVLKKISFRDEDELCAQIAQISYKEKSSRPEIFSGYNYDKNLSNPTECVYISKEKKNVIFWIRWTVITDVSDITSDIKMVLDIQNIDPRVQKVLDMYDTIKREYQGYSIRVCWHSLWWTLSYIIAKHRNPDRCVVFNPWVVVNTLFIKMLQDTLTQKKRVSKTYTYKILWDIVSSIAFVWNTDVFFIKKTDPLQLHTIDNFAIVDI